MAYSWCVMIKSGCSGQHGPLPGEPFLGRGRRRWRLRRRPQSPSHRARHATLMHRKLGRSRVNARQCSALCPHRTARSRADDERTGKSDRHRSLNPRQGIYPHRSWWSKGDDQGKCRINKAARRRGPGKRVTGAGTHRQAAKQGRRKRSPRSSNLAVLLMLAFFRN